MAKPKDLTQYKYWMEYDNYAPGINGLGINGIEGKIKRHYESVSLFVKNEFKKTDFWKCLKNELAESETSYGLIKNGYPLLMTNPEKLDLDIKEYERFLTKTYRANIIDNDNWTDIMREPNGGWVTPKNWFSRIDDIVRTMIVVKYLDGVEFLVERLKKLCDTTGLTQPDERWQAKDEGYYAAHLYIEKEYSIPTLEFGSEKVPIKVEIQVTTQLQESIYKITHRYYEERRLKEKSNESKWQWNYESQEFIPNYLGHILHYLEGMIMEVRNRELQK